jgi:hypothetical protein
VEVLKLARVEMSLDCLDPVASLKACIGHGRTHLLGLELIESLIWKYIGRHVVVSLYVLKFDPLEVSFEFLDLSTVGIHHVFDAVPLLVDLFNDDLRIAES